MDTFFALLKKSLVATLFVIFAFVGTYVPQNFNEVETVHAGGRSTFGGQLMLNISALAGNVEAAASAAYGAVTSALTKLMANKELYLDGLAWAIAKNFVHEMVGELVNWINSGFEGSPAFVSDLSDFLLGAADRGIGKYIEELGAFGSFICSPFRLDVQLAVAVQYQRLRIDQSAPTCSLTGVIDNIEGFMDGTQGSFSQNGGWNDWFDITAKPQTYTPYGAAISAQVDAQTRVINIKNEEGAVLNFGDGFLSGKVCQEIVGPVQPGQPNNCYISKPGKILQEALTFNLDSGRQSLIAADEINEVLLALLRQLANQAITGANGLLGLSAGNPFTYQGYDAGSYLDELVASTTLALDLSGILAEMEAAREIQIAYATLTENYIPLLQDFADLPSQNPQNVADALGAITDANNIASNADLYLGFLDEWIALLNDPQTTDDQKTNIAVAFAKLNPYIQQDIDHSEAVWEGILNRPNGPITQVDFADNLSRMNTALSDQHEFNDLATFYQQNLTDFAADPANNAAARADATIAIGEANTVIQNTNTAIATLEEMIATFEDPATTDEEKLALINEFALIDFFTDVDMRTTQIEWDAILAVVP